MGLFARNKVKKPGPGELPPASFTDPPNVYISSSPSSSSSSPPPPPPPRPPPRPEAKDKSRGRPPRQSHRSKKQSNASKTPKNSSTSLSPTASRPHPEPVPSGGPYIFQHHNNYSQPQLRCQSQPASHLPPPPRWTPQPPAPAPASAPLPVAANHQHYHPSGSPYDNAWPQQQRPQHTEQGHGSSLGLNHWTRSMVDLSREVMPACGLTSARLDSITSRLDDVMTLIDREACSGNESGLFSFGEPVAPYEDGSHHRADSASGERALYKPSKRAKDNNKGPPNAQSGNTANDIVSGTYFSKVELYANSKLPLDLPPLAVYIPTWPLLCLAAQFSQSVYTSPRGAERSSHVSADWLAGTKAMRIKSIPMDHSRTIVFAVRGTATFFDWAVNLRDQPASPQGFLDDPGNLCHAGFLAVARRTVAPVAARLRTLLEENPRRAAYSLLITGHSAGGAVAALLYSHMLSRDPAAQSDLTALAGCFKRVHCVTFGAPPVSLLPLVNDPDRRDLKKSIFMSIVNEGDPVVRADKTYVKSLLELLATPAPAVPPSSSTKDAAKKMLPSGAKKSKSRADLRSKSSRPNIKPPTSSSSSSLPPPLPSRKPIWPVPPCTLSNAGRIVVLRSGNTCPRNASAKSKSGHNSNNNNNNGGSPKPARDRRTLRDRLDEGVVAVTCREDQLRGVVWGDPLCHMMSLYAARIETLAVGAVTATSH